MLSDKITEAQHRIEDLYHETEGHCYVSFSGGKDSTVLLALIKSCEELYTIPEGKIPAVFSNTGIELGVTVDFVKWVKENYYHNVEIIRPEKSFDWVLKNEGKPVKSKLKSELMRRWKTCNRTEYLRNRLLYGTTENGYDVPRSKIADKDMHMVHDDFPITPSPKCCDHLKKKPLNKYARDKKVKGELMGIRTAEEGTRNLAAQKRVKQGGSLCSWEKHGILFKAPMIDWTDADVDEYIERFNVPLSDAYTKYGFSRTGCMACPFSRNIDIDLKYLFEHEPNRYKASMHWLKDVYIAQNVVLPFDHEYEEEREKEWRERYEPMRQEMLRKYRPNSRLIKDSEQLSLFD